MKFRKKPVVIEAWEVPPNPPLLGTNPPVWVLDGTINGVLVWHVTGGVTVRTLEGDMEGKVGDWLIQGVKGELYPCKSDIFAATYEPVEAEGGGQ